MRDNFIKATGSYNEDEWCRDMVGSLFHNHGGADHCGLIAWTQPWDVSGWEVTLGFATKWNRLLKGCGDLIEWSNRWRALRHEEPLLLDILVA